MFLSHADPFGHSGPVANVGVSAPDVDLITHGDIVIKLSSLRGKWVLLQFGATWSPKSEAAALVASNIRDSLNGYPFEFVQVFDDPSVWDAELFGFTQFSGICAVVGKKPHLGMFSNKRPSAWYLLDPAGIVRAAGLAESAKSLRQALRRAWKDDLAMHDVPLASTPAQSREENLLQPDVRGASASTVEKAEAILRDDPGNELALRFLLHAMIWTKNYSEANKVLAERVAGREVSDCTRIYMTLSRLVACDNTAAREELLAWWAKYPESKYLQSIATLLLKLPEDVKSDEMANLRSAWKHPRGWDTKHFLGFVHQWAGSPTKAEKYLSVEKGRGVLGQLGLADQLQRQGRITEASALVKKRQNLSPENATPVEAFEQMLWNTVLMEWKIGGEFARCYQKLRPEKAQGFLVEWLIARCSGDNERASEIRKIALALMKTSKRYDVASKLLELNREPTVKNLTDIDDLNVRFDTALLFVLLDWEDKNSPSRMLITAQRAFWPSDWPYAFLNKLRSLDIQKSPPDGWHSTPQSPGAIADAGITPVVSSGLFER